jgi:TM2 domain-containing membrane protein YozV
LVPVVSSVELVWAPPVLTTTPGGTWVVVEFGCCSAEVDAVAFVASCDSDVALLVGDDGDDCEEDCDVDDSDVDGDASVVSAHATPYPWPVATAAPTPRATAKAPTRPTYAAAFMHIAYASSDGGAGGFAESDTHFPMAGPTGFQHAVGNIAAMTTPQPNYSTAPTPPPPQVDASGRPLSDKSKLTAGLLGIFLGSFGVGRFYLGYTTIGIAQVAVTWLTLGIGGLWPLIDAILILAGKVPDAQGRTLRD